MRAELIERALSISPRSRVPSLEIGLDLSSQSITIVIRGDRKTMVRFTPVLYIHEVAHLRIFIRGSCTRTRI